MKHKLVKEIVKKVVPPQIDTRKKVLDGLIKDFNNEDIVNLKWNYQNYSIQLNLEGVKSRIDVKTNWKGDIIRIKAEVKSENCGVFAYRNSTKIIRIINDYFPDYRK